MNVRIACIRRAGRLAPALVLTVGLALAAGCSGGDPPQNNNNVNNTSDRCPAGYLLVPKGTFTMGVDAEDLAGLDITWSPEMGPAHRVTLTADFCMSKTEVTVAEYRQCRSTGACTGEGPWPVEQDDRCNFSETDHSRDSHPVNCLTYEQAREHCQAQGGDLPTEAQWIRAAQGDDRRHFAWGGSEPDCSHANYDANGSGGTEPNGLGCAETQTPPFTWATGSAPAGASPYGLVDMTGNVAEYVHGCGAWFQACDGELGCVDPQPTGCDGDPYRLSLGGSASTYRLNLFSFLRGADTYDRSPDVGMRCVQAPKNR